MAGTFAHITLVDLLSQANSTQSMESFTQDMKEALPHFKNFCELGAVSPDCPFLVLGDHKTKGWGNVMHYWQTADFIRRAIPFFAGANFQNPDIQRCFAWLCGYVGHVVTDLTIHPVIKEKVGDYFTHQKRHRECELHQDVYIFKKIVGESLTRVDYLSDNNAGIGSCHADNTPKRLHLAIGDLWRNCLDQIDIQGIRMGPDAIVPQGPPDPDRWFHDYAVRIEDFAVKGGRIPIFRNMVENEGLVYPEDDKCDRRFIDNLRTPTGGEMNYDQVFDLAKDNVKASWEQLASAITKGDAGLFWLKNGDLDTGLDESSKSIFWS
jgi:hypothetical protein